MITMLNAWGESWAGYFGLAVLQHTLFLGLIFLGLYLLRNARAGIRYGLCVIGMAKLVLPLFLPSGFLASLGPLAGSGGARSVSGVVTLSPVAGLPGPGEGATPAQGPGLGLAGGLLLAWALFVAFCLVRAALSYLRLRRELASAVPVGGCPGGLGQEGTGVEIMKSAAIPVALTFGIVGPRIYVPDAWDGWSDRFRRMS